MRAKEGTTRPARRGRRPRVVADAAACLILLGGLSGAAAALGDALDEVDGEPALVDLDRAWTFSFFFENDLFADTDQNYTNGIKLSWISPEVSRYVERLPRWTEPYVDRLPFIHREGPEQQRNVVVSLGQLIFTPQDIEDPALIADDRPYAGWLYLGVAFQNRNPRTFDDLEVQLGVIGPLSLAEQAQTLVHEVRGIIKPRGWSHQLDTEPGIALVYHRLWRHVAPPLWRSLGLDAVTYAGGALGNVFIHADVGVILRFGWNLPADFGSSLIRPGSDTNAPIDPARAPARSALGVHAFVAGEGRAKLRDIFLDGNTLSDSHRVDKRHLVGDFAVGAGLVWRGLKLSFARVVRTREFEGQERVHRFGSITLSFSSLFR